MVAPQRKIVKSPNRPQSDPIITHNKTMADEEKKEPPAAPDSDEEDEDYVPPADGGSDNEGGGGRGGGGADGRAYGKSSHDDDDGRPRLPAHKQKAVDEAFASLFGAPATTGATSPTSNSSALDKKGKKKKSAKSKKALKKKKNLLASMFGKAAAGKLMATSSVVIKSDTESRKRDRPLQGLEKKVVTEKKVFAGKEIEVKRTVVELTTRTTAAASAAGTATAPSGSAVSASASLPAAAPAAEGIDSVLANIGGPQKMSTVAKTSSDWDTFKDRTGLDEELEEKAKGKDAYLVKKDFLDRVDQRTFEVQKAERDRKRAAAGR